MKLSKKLSGKQFFIAHFLILTFSLIFLFGLYFILNIQYKVSSNPFLNGPVTTLPKTLTLDLTEPGDESLIFKDTVVISGQTAPLKEVLIFSTSQNLIVKSASDGSFSANLGLDPGVNKITAVTFDSTGEAKSVERTIYYSEEKI